MGEQGWGRRCQGFHLVAQAKTEKKNLCRNISKIQSRDRSSVYSQIKREFEPRRYLAIRIDKCSRML